MTQPEQLSFLLRVMRIVDCGFRGPSPEILFWRTDREYAPFKIFVICSDVFAWACADMEELTPANIHVLEAAVADLDTADRGSGYVCADTLFCSRVRGMRPQGAYYKNIERQHWPLFDACGPEREVGIDNPYPIPD